MTDKREAITQIEKLLGADGSRALAAEMLTILKYDGFVTFDAVDGYVIQPDIDEHKFMAIAERADEGLQEN